MEIGEFLDVFFRNQTALLAGDGVGEKVQFALRGDARIELAQAVYGGVARIGKGFLPVFGLAFIEPGKVGFEHQHFAAYLDEFGRISPCSRRGMLATVLTFRVTSSPVVPSPRVAACTNTPSR